jgi:hypothetical protein
MMVDIDEPVARVRVYEREANQSVVARSLADLRLPDGLVTLVSAYPEVLRCAR